MFRTIIKYAFIGWCVKRVIRSVKAAVAHRSEARAARKLTELPKTKRNLEFDRDFANEIEVENPPMRAYGALPPENAPVRAEEYRPTVIETEEDDDTTVEGEEVDEDTRRFHRGLN